MILEKDLDFPFLLPSLPPWRTSKPIFCLDRGVEWKTRELVWAADRRWGHRDPGATAGFLQPEQEVWSFLFAGGRQGGGSGRGSRLHRRDWACFNNTGQVPATLSAEEVWGFLACLSPRSP